MKVRFFDNFLLLTLSLLGLVGSAGGVKAVDYQAPDPSRFPFYTESMTIPQEEKRQVADQLVALAVNYPVVAKFRPQLAAQSLALAMALDPTHPTAATISGDLSSGKTPEPLEGYGKAPDLLHALWKKAAGLEKRALGNDEQSFAYYLMSVVDQAVPPRDKRYAHLRNILRRAPEDAYPGWTKVLGEPLKPLPGREEEVADKPEKKPAPALDPAFPDPRNGRPGQAPNRPERPLRPNLPKPPEGAIPGLRPPRPVPAGTPSE